MEDRRSRMGRRPAHFQRSSIPPSSRQTMSGVTDRIREIEACIRFDPAGRGLLSGSPESPGLGQGHLAEAARSIVQHGRLVGIVTGFAIPMPSGPLAETDGPVGSIVLADVLIQLGIEVCLISDELSRTSLLAVADFANCPRDRIATCQLDPDAARRWCADFIARNPVLSHLVAVERVGPSHTSASFCSQTRSPGAALQDFRSLHPEEHHGRCFNMRGEPIDSFTAPLHHLFDLAAASQSPLSPESVLNRSLASFGGEGPGVRGCTKSSSGSTAHDTPAVRRIHTIGIGDGGNEIGMGSFLWESLHPLVPGGHGPRIVCRIPTDWTVVAGTSNWGAYALAAAVALLAGRPDVLHSWPEARHEQLLRHLVQHGPAVDGVTREREPTVDGLPFMTYIQPWTSMLQLAAPS